MTISVFRALYLRPSVVSVSYFLASVGVAMYALLFVHWFVTVL